MIKGAILFALSYLFTFVKADESISNIVVFGDSYSDAGNNQKLTNGPLWNENLALGWDASLYNFAFSGAVCNNSLYSKQKSFIPSVVDQVEMFYHQNLTLKPEETVVIFWVGVNDIYKSFENKNGKDIEQQMSKTVECISTNIRNVRRVFSYNKFIVFGVPPLERMPYYVNSDVKESRQKAADILNEELKREVEKLNKHLQNLELDTVDIHNLLNDIMDKPELFNITNANDPFWDACQGQCTDDVNSYVWWDKAHLTGGVHRLIANSILTAGSLAPKTSVDEDSAEIIEQTSSGYKSPIYKGAKNTGLIEKKVKQMNEAAEEEDNLDNETNDLSTENESKTNHYLLYGAGFVALSCTGFIIFIKTNRRRGQLGSLSNLLKMNSNNRGQFVPLRNLESNV